MAEKKLKIVQVSGHSNIPWGCHDVVADDVLRSAGFVSRSDIKPSGGYLTTGAIPGEGKELFVYYDEPGDEGFNGRFRLIRVESGKEIVVDEGCASESHFHGGLETTTFYGKGKVIDKWSFHCEPQE